MGNYDDNRIIKTTVKKLNALDDERYAYMIADVMMHRMYEGAVAPTPFEGEKIASYTDSKGRKWIPLFTDIEEFNKGESTSEFKDISMLDILKEGLENPDLKGVIINPYGESRKLEKGTLEMTFMVYKKEFTKD